jgi:hypothetical protein
LVHDWQHLRHLDAAGEKQNLDAAGEKQNLDAGCTLTHLDTSKQRKLNGIVQQVQFVRGSTGREGSQPRLGSGGGCLDSRLASGETFTVNFGASVLTLA